MKLLRKFPKNYQKCFTSEESSSQRMRSRGGPQTLGGLLARLGGPAPPGRLGDLGTTLVSPLALFIPPKQKPKISNSFFQKRSRSPPPLKPSFGGHEDLAPAPCRRGPWPPGSSSSTLLRPMMDR